MRGREEGGCEEGRREGVRKGEGGEMGKVGMGVEKGGMVWGAEEKRVGKRGGRTHRLGEEGGGGERESKEWMERVWRLGQRSC